MWRAIKVILFALLTCVLWLALLTWLWTWWFFACNDWSFEGGTTPKPCDFFWWFGSDVVDNLNALGLVLGLILLTALATRHLVRMLRSTARKGANARPVAPPPLP
jgi:hypothetical protein